WSSAFVPRRGAIVPRAPVQGGPVSFAGSRPPPPPPPPHAQVNPFLKETDRSPEAPEVGLALRRRRCSSLMRGYPVG
ncbi:hypothetical protein NDU88_000274, partial [Pleurodeles waltl]